MKPNQLIEADISSLDPTFGNGGIGYARAHDGELYFFHCRNVKDSSYSELQVGQRVLIRPIRAKKAMGASPRTDAIFTKLAN